MLVKLLYLVDKISTIMEIINNISYFFLACFSCFLNFKKGKILLKIIIHIEVR